MSVRTLLDQSPMPRYYNHYFEVEIRPDAPQFKPDKSLEAEGRRRTDAVDRRKVGYRLDNVELYRKLVLIFPEATAIGYVPPISAWHIGDMEKHGVLNGYINALFGVAPVFSTFVDFSLPSAITLRTNVTYDGSHYDPAVNRLIADRLQGNSKVDWGVDVKKTPFADYTQSYHITLTGFKNQLGRFITSYTQHD